MSAKKDYSLFPPEVRFPPGIDNHTGYCDYCNRHRPTAHVRITEASPETWFLCVPCIRANHTDAEVAAAVDERNRAVEEARREHERQAAEAKARAEVEARRCREPQPFSRQTAVADVVRLWDDEEIDTRQAEHLCTAIHAGYWDVAAPFRWALDCARMRHSTRYRRPLGARNPMHKHRSRLPGSDLHKSPEDLRTLIRQLDETLALAPDPTWKRELCPEWWSADMRLSHEGVRIWVPGLYAARCALLKRRYRWMTGREYTPYTIETAQLEKEAS